MIRKLASISAVLLVATGLAACGSGGGSGGGDTPEASDLNGRYISKSFEAPGVNKDQEFTIVFDSTTDPDTPGFSAGVGCNSINGTFQIKDGEMVASQPISTMIGCPPDQAKAEAWLTELLTGSPEITLDDGKLKLSGEAGTLNLEETAKVDAPTVEDTKWILDGISEGGAVGSVPMGVKPPTLTFKKGQVEVFGGCNRGGGKAVVDDDSTITFSPVFMTRMSCGGVANRFEKQIVDFLNGKVDYSWEGTNLVLTKNGKSLILTS